jgi:hypothetical protein
MFIFKVICFLDFVHLGEALRDNPGYLKLRKVRAAQRIARTVGYLSF